MSALMRSLFSGGETAYRETYWKEDREQARLVIFIVAIMVVMLAIVDYQFLGNSDEFLMFLAGRMTFLGVSIAVYSGIKQHIKIKQNDYAILFWACSLAVLTLAIDATRPNNFSGNIVLHGIMVLGSYSLIPNRLLFKIIPALAFTIFDMIILFFYKTEIPPPTLAIGIITLITVNVMGMATSLRLDAYRRNQHEAKIFETRNRMQLVELATTDSLTGVYNRRHFIGLGEIEFDRYKRFGHIFSFVVMDIDKFKSINDTYGHPFGDAVLQSFCTVLSSEKRSVDIIGRLGGDEFGIILPETSARDAAKVIQRIKRFCRQLGLNPLDEKFRITISVGLTAARPSDQSMEDLYHRADKGLYQNRLRNRKL